MKKKSRFREFVESIIAALFLVFLAKALLFFPTKVEGASMNPTLQQGDKIIVSKLITYTHHVRHGDIIVMKTDDYYVKRVIGIPGDVIEMKEDMLYINGQPQNESYLTVNQTEAHRLMMNFTENFGPITVPQDELFVMGDNRLISRDSRNGMGFIQTDDVLGKVEAVYYPFHRIQMM